MEGRRFGAGILGGLVLGLLIVGASGSYTGLAGTFIAASPAQGEVKNPTSSTVLSSSVVSTFTTTSPEVAVVGGTTVTTSSATTSVASTQQQSQSSQPQPASQTPNIMAFLSNGADQKAASRLDSIGTQPALVDGIVLLPLLVALILGMVLYRASRRDKGGIEPESEE